MNHIAQLLAAQGRNGDTELLHVTKKELAALRGIGALTGARVTRNPVTGLPEAFNFEQIIPAIVGVGATVLSGGTLSPLMAGMISGAATTAATGDINQGLMAGLTGGAASGLASGFMGGAAATGAAAAPTATSAAAAPMATEAAGQAAATGMSGGAQAAQAGAWAPGFGEAAVDAAGGAQAAGTWAPGFGEAAVDAGAATTSQGGTMSAQQSGIGGMMDYAMSNPTGTMALAGAMDSAMQPSASGGGMSREQEEAHERAKPEKHSSRDFMQPSDPYYAMNGGEHDYFSDTRYNFNAGGPVLTPAEMYRRQQEEEQKKWAKPPETTYNSGMSMPTPGMSPMGFAGGGPVLPRQVQEDTGAMKAIKAIRSRYRSRKAAEEDMEVPNSFMQRIGIRDPMDPILDYAFGYTKKQGRRKMQSGNLAMPMGFANGGAVPRGMDMPLYMAKRLKDQSTQGMAHIARGDREVEREPGRYPSTRKKDPSFRPGMPMQDMDGLRRFQPERNGRAQPTMMAKGGPVKGAGDGMSDSVPAKINGRQPAQLANDEFVVPADVVSHLGNGSSEAGHAQLYDMIRRVRGARTGTTRQAPAINPKKVMP